MARPRKKQLAPHRSRRTAPDSSAMPKKSAWAVAVLLIITVFLWWTGRRVSTTPDTTDLQPTATPNAGPRVEPRQTRVETPVDDALRKKIAETAHQNLNTMFRLAASRTAPSAEWPTIVDRHFTSDPLRPDQLERIYRDDCVLVQRGRVSPSHTTAPPSTSADKSLPLLSTLQTVLGPADQWKPAITILNVQPHGDTVTTQVRVVLITDSREHRAQIRSLWHCQWNREDDQLRLKAVRVLDYEEVAARYPDRDWLVEYTPSVIGHNPSYRDQLVFGLDHWLERIERVHQMDASSAQGIAVGDANGDGLDDIYVCQPGGLPNRLYTQNLDGTAHDVSQRSQTDWLDNSSSALFADLDNDGDQDLIVATHSALLAMKNDGAARFTLSARIATQGAEPQSLSAADYDNDSDLDLYVCFGSSDVVAGPPDKTRAPVRQSQPGPPNLMIRNEFVPSGQWQFTDATNSTGLDADNRQHSFAASWEDFDGDGDQDLYVANRDGANCLNENNAGNFTNVAGQWNISGQNAGNSVNWADFDRDAQIDLFVGAAAEPDAAAADPSSSASGLDRTIHDNSPRPPNAASLLLRHTAKKTFDQVATAADLGLQQPAWCSISLDLNNDGWEDLVTAAQSHRGWLNLSAFRFADISAVSRLDLRDDGRAIAATDWDQDGDVDLWTVNRNSPQLRLLINETPTNQHYVALQLVGTQCNRDAIGARVEVVLRGGGPRHRKTLRAGEGYLTQSSKWLHFGLGRTPRIERIDVHWPGGKAESFPGLAADAHYRLTQGASTAELVATGERTIVIRPAPAPRPEPNPLQLVLAAPLTLTDLSYTTSGGDIQPVRTSENRPLVLHLAANRSDDSLAQLGEFAARRADLGQSGIDLLALAAETRAPPFPEDAPADQQSDPPEFRFLSGRAGHDLLDRLQQTFRQCFDSNGALPIPCTLLIEGDGRLSAIYTGPVTVERLLADVAKLNLDDVQRRAASLPFSGRWASQPATGAGDQRASGSQRQRRQLHRPHGEVNRSSTSAKVYHRRTDSFPSSEMRRH